MTTTTLSSVIPAAKLAAVETALLKAFHTTGITSISLLHGGLSDAAVYKLEVNGSVYVLKSDVPAQPGVDLYECITLAAKAGVSPQVYYANAGTGICISAFIEPKPLRGSFPSNELLLRALAGTIQRIHAMPLFTKPGDTKGTVQGLIGQCRVSGMFSDAAFEECFGYYNAVLEQYPWEADQVSSHNDLNPNNILCDGAKLWVVDWDAASVNNRYIDLAIVANTFVQNEAQETFFLHAYFGNSPDACQRARFFVTRQTAYLVYALMMFQLAGRANAAIAVEQPYAASNNMEMVRGMLYTGALSLATAEGQMLYGQALFNQALHNMRSPAFAAALAGLRHAV
ncbi:phosphotransferase [Deminuibacter soli]|nr:phosphotransferase [Deminuibacter soli]